MPKLYYTIAKTKVDIAGQRHLRAINSPCPGAGAGEITKFKAGIHHILELLLWRSFRFPIIKTKKPILLHGVKECLN